MGANVDAELFKLLHRGGDGELARVDGDHLDERLVPRWRCEAMPLEVAYRPVDAQPYDVLSAPRSSEVATVHCALRHRRAILGGMNAFGPAGVILMLIRDNPDHCGTPRRDWC
jgi:hypothetical protein